MNHQQDALVTCLSSTQRIAGAAWATLLIHDAEANEMRNAATTAPLARDRGIGKEALLEITALGEGSPCWIGEARSLLLVRVDTQAQPGHWLLLQFDRLSTAARDRVCAVASACAKLLGAVVDLLHDQARLEHRDHVLSAILNQHECGIVALREDQTILFKNAAATAVLGAGLIHQTGRGTLRPRAYRDAVRFQTALDQIIADRTPRGSPARPTGMIMLLTDPEGKDHPVISVMTPVPPALKQAELNDAVAVLYLMRSDQSVARGLEPICQLHGLSPVETRLVTHLVGGLSVNDAATEMRIKPDTARAYLKQVFVKTNTHRQSSLVRIITRYQRAVRGDFDFRIA